MTRTIKAITLHAPWGDLMRWEEKKFETRSWQTRYRGLIAIHQGLKSVSPHSLGDYFCYCFRLSLRKQGMWEIEDYKPSLGCVVAVARLENCYPTELVRHTDAWNLDFPGRELAYGDYYPNRYAWYMKLVYVPPQPIPALGKQGLWNWTVPDGLVLP